MPTIEGALKGLFTVDTDGKQVRFSQGNLRFLMSHNMWRFAEHQYDVMGENNNYLSDTYDGWVDLLGWSPQATAMNITNADNSQYWYLMSKKEWDYLLYDRADALSKRGWAYVNGQNGCILLPDNWTLPTGCTFVTNKTNNYTFAQWNKMEQAGAVFLPAAGQKVGTVGELNVKGYYWTSTQSNSNAYVVTFEQTTGVSIKSAGVGDYSIRYVITAQ